MSKLVQLVSLLFALMFAASATHAQELAPDGSRAHEQLDASLWVQSSAEFHACAKQAFSIATEKLPMALRDRMWTASPEQFETGDYAELPPAVIVNLDETVWNNGGYQARLILQYGQHSGQRFVEWCNEAKCELNPGAKGFLRTAAKHGVSIIYITPRPEITRDGTVQNLKKLELPYDVENDKLIMGGGWPDHDKREEVGQTHRILLIVSDHIGDFLHGTGAGEAADRRKMAADKDSYWGLKWFVVPNPMYGHWEYSIQNYDYSLDRPKRIQNKLDALKTAAGHR